MEYAYARHREIRKCEICHVYCEYSNDVVVITHRQYHRTCLDKLWFDLDKWDRYRLLDKYTLHKRNIKFE